MKVHPLILLFDIQFLLLFLALSVIFIKKYIQQKKTISHLNNELSEMYNKLDFHKQDSEEKEAQLILLKQMLDDFEKKFEKIRDANAKLKESIALLIPEAERSKEYEKIIEQIEKTNRELDVCVNSLKYENKNLNKKAKSLKIDLEMLKRKISTTVDKTEYEKVCNDKKVLEEKVKELEHKLSDQLKEYEKLSKDYQWLEKEYNALYKNTGENSETPEPINQPS